MDNYLNNFFLEQNIYNMCIIKLSIKVYGIQSAKKYKELWKYSNNFFRMKCTDYVVHNIEKYRNIEYSIYSGIVEIFVIIIPP